MTNAVVCLGMKEIVVEFVGYAASLYAGNSNPLLGAFQTVAGKKCVAGAIDDGEDVAYVKKEGYDKIVLNNILN